MKYSLAVPYCCAVQSRHVGFVLLSLAALTITAMPCDADIISQTLSGYNSAVVSAGVVNPTGQGQIQFGYDANTGGSAFTEGLVGYAQAFPGKNESSLVANSGPLRVGDQVLAGAADAEANVHYILMNKLTGKVDSFGEVEIFIKGSAALAKPFIGPEFGVTPSAVWAVYIGEDSPPPQLSLTHENGVLIGATLTHPSDRAAVAIGTATAGGQVSQYSDTFTAVTTNPSASLEKTLFVVALSDGIIDVDETADIQGIGYAAVDPVLTPVNPNDILVSDAPSNPNADAPLFTSSQAARLSAEGVDLSGLQSLDLIGPSTVPEARSVLLIAFGLGTLALRSACSKVMSAPIKGKL